MDPTEQFLTVHNGHPVLKFCERFDETSNIWDFNLHSHPYLELMFFLEGTASVELAGAQLSVSLFDTVVYPANCPHREDPSPDLRREIICLWVDMPELQPEEPLQIQDRSGQLSALFQSVHRHWNDKTQAPYLMEHLLKVLLLQVLQLASTEDRHPVLTTAVQYIHAHFTERITLQTLSELEHISVSYLSRQFRRRMGMTVIDYVNHLRIEMAKHLLVTTDKNMMEISYQVGYESPKYFYRIFRSLCQDSPAAFRRRYARIPGTP